MSLVGLLVSSLIFMKELQSPQEGTNSAGFCCQDRAKQSARRARRGRINEWNYSAL